MTDLLQSWLDRYLVAWKTNDPDDIGALFTDDATYAGDPFDPEPWTGREGIVAGWLAHKDDPGTWTFEGAPLVYADGVGIIQGRTDYDGGKTYANLWVLHLDEDGRASSFVEWYMRPHHAPSAATGAPASDAPHPAG